MVMFDHDITILNFIDSETVSHPIIKIIGNIKGATKKIANKNVHLSQNNGVLITTNLIDDKFKFLLELTNGKNEINIKFCQASTSLELNYCPVSSHYGVTPLYVICEDHDGYFQAPKRECNNIESACKRITLGSKLLQCLTAEKLYEYGLGRKTFALNEECRVFRSRIRCQDARRMSQMELWTNVGREIMSSPIASDRTKYLAFLSCTKYNGDKYNPQITNTHDELLQITEGYVALGGGGLALFGTACLYTWPEHFEDVISRFEDNTPVDRSQFLDDSCYRGTLGACFSTTLGSVLHELFHTFDLGHTQDGIMGRGFDNIYKVFTSFESSKSSQDKIEFKEEFEPDSLLERIKSENKKKEFVVIKKFEEVDDTVLTKSCAVILCYHRWFNRKTTSKESSLTFDPPNKLIKSTEGIRVVEIRSLDRELVSHNWVFDGRILRYSFQLPQDVLSAGNYFIFVENSAGCILKEKFSV